RRGAARRRAALEQREGRVERRRGQDLLEAERLAELGPGIVDRVLVVLHGDAREGLRARPIALHVLAAGVAEHLSRDERVAALVTRRHRRHMTIERLSAVRLRQEPT